MSAAEEIPQTLAVLFEPGQVVELRAFKGRTIASGYFDDHEALAAEAVGLDRKLYQVYVTLNEINPDLLARAANRLLEYPKATTSDRDVVRLRWLPLDFDPVRPSNVSSSAEEKRAAKLRAQEVRQFLRGEGWPDPVVGDSGNGYHLLYGIDLPNTQESRDLIKGVLDSLAFRFDDEQVKVDTGVHNPARIWKLYGTVARKGDSVASRPQRCSRVVKVPSQMETV
jgi:hypothetical protein